MQHVTGEAIYCDDIPKMKNELFLELVWSKRAHAFLKSVDFSKALKIDGVLGFISHEDLTKERNMFGIIEKDEEVFATDKVFISYRYSCKSLYNVYIYYRFIVSDS